MEREQYNSQEHYVLKNANKSDGIRRTNIIEFDNKKVELVEHSIEFSETDFIETGGVSGYTRWHLNWEQLNNAIPSGSTIENLEMYREWFSPHNENEQAQRDSRRLSHFFGELAKEFTGKEFFNRESSYHTIGAVSGSDYFQEKAIEIFTKKLLLQIPFDPEDVIRLWQKGLSVKDNQSIVPDTWFNFFDKLDKKRLIPKGEYALYNIDPDYWNAFSPFKLEKHNLPLDERIRILRDGFRDNIAVLTRPSAGYGGGVSLADSAGGGVQIPGRGDHGFFPHDQITLEFNYNNLAFKKYISNIAKELGGIVIANSNSGVDDSQNVSKVLASKENWQDVKNSSLFLHKGEFNHPIIPIVFSDYPKFHWAHCNRAIIPTKNGVSFVQTKTESVNSK